MKREWDRYKEAETRQPANLRNPAALCAWREACVKQMF